MYIAIFSFYIHRYKCCLDIGEGVIGTGESVTKVLQDLFPAELLEAILRDKVIVVDWECQRFADETGYEGLYVP